MRPLKSNIAQKKGFKETQRGVWLPSIPISSTFSLKIQKLKDAYFGMSDAKILYETMTIFKKFYGT